MLFAVSHEIYSLEKSFPTFEITDTFKPNCLAANETYVGGPPKASDGLAILREMIRSIVKLPTVTKPNILLQR